MGKSSSGTKAGGEFKMDRSASRSTASTEVPSGLTSPPGLAHFLYMLTVYRYMLLCLLFGLMSVILGVSLLSMSMVLRSKTSSMQLLESVPLYMPGLILICNGTSLIAFMQKNTRRFYLLKSVCGLFLLVALLLIIVSVTTSVIHIPRLHSHRECAYTERLRACTCVQNSASSSVSSKHFTMEEIDSCELVHGIMYDSLRVVFALSLVAILTSVFSILTLYRLYIHEKQKAYFSQLNSLRHRIHQRNAMQSCDPSDVQSNYYLDHFNHLYSVDGTAPSATATERSYLPQVKCLSADFSSQDMLIDQSSTNFGVSNPKDQADLFSRGRIWSSQLSNFAQASDQRSESVNLHKTSPKTATMRRYMSVIFDRSSNVQSFLRQKLNSFRRGQGNERLDKRHYSKVSKSQLLPPHVIIPRYSMAQSSIGSTIINVSTERTTPSEQMRKSVSMHSSSSSHRSTSTSSTSAKSKLPPEHSKSTRAHKHSMAEYNSHNQRSERKRFSEQSAPSNEQSYNRISDGIESCGLHYQSARLMNAVPESYLYGSWQASRQQLQLQESGSMVAPSWSHSSVMDTSHFKCIDEDDLPATSEHFALEHNSQATRFGANPESATFFMESKPLRCLELDRTLPNSNSNSKSPNGSAEEEAVSITPVPSSNKFTFGSQQSTDNRQYMTTFEEAFKNYYDSQHRISSQNNSQEGAGQQHYYTMPVKIATTNKEHRSKRKGCHSRPERSIEPELQQLQKQQAAFQMDTGQMDDVAAMMMSAGRSTEPQCHPMYCHKTPDAQVEEDPTPAEAQYMSEDELFPAIEPPADYKNVATVEACPMETLTNQLMQPYQIWVQQFIDQMNAINYTQAGDTAKVFNNAGSMEGYANGFEEDDDDDDGAGDTSTSQDIADFELELDEEPIKFIGEEEYKAKVEVEQPQVPAKTAFKTQPTHRPVPPAAAALDTGLDEQQQQFSLLKKNTELIRRAVQMNKASADYGFDGFRKGCFDDDDDSSTESSLSDGTGSSEESTHSVTAEYIKPPTPFTNNYFVNN